MRLYDKDSIPAEFQPRHFTAAQESKGVTFAHEPLNLEMGKVDNDSTLPVRSNSQIPDFVNCDLSVMTTKKRPCNTRYEQPVTDARLYSC
jgi:hypothetical protein